MWGCHHSHWIAAGSSKVDRGWGRHWLIVIALDLALRQTCIIASHTQLTNVNVSQHSLQKVPDKASQSLSEPQAPLPVYEELAQGKEAMGCQTPSPGNSGHNSSLFCLYPLWWQRKYQFFPFLVSASVCGVWDKLESKSINSRFVISLNMCSFYNEIHISEPFLAQTGRFPKVSFPSISEWKAQGCVESVLFT